MSAPDWVKARGNCTIEDTFKVLVETIRKDIRSFNQLSARQRGDKFFHPEKTGDGWAVCRALVLVNQGKTTLEADPQY
ncbi:MAG: hypothetical protein F4Y04_07830, partial [Chloroflexi bacterium]|nr:hypothetical protein [Chloroflexota bacterium]